MGLHSFCWSAQVRQSVPVLLFGQDKSLLLREERKDLAVLEGMPENYKYTMA